jgi:segregation and condensation protein B
MDNGYRTSVVEALILASSEPLPARKILDVTEGLTPHKVGQLVAELNNRYMQAGCSFRIRELAGGYQFYVVPEFAGYVQELFTRRRKIRFTRAALETLAIAAYRQPVTKAEIEHIRGVASDGVIHNLLEKKLVTIVGRAKTVGKPLQYGTTDEFLKFFGLAALSDLPKMSEIEELIRAGEPENQQELPLEMGGLAEAAQKLNVADGTFDPGSRDDDDPEASEDRSAIAVPGSGGDRDATGGDNEAVDSTRSGGVIVDLDATADKGP